jgi:hypothetical protein
VAVLIACGGRFTHHPATRNHNKSQPLNRLQSYVTEVHVSLTLQR